MLLGCQDLQGRSGHDAGRQLLAQLYRDATGESLPPIALSPRGKPYFPDSPWHFSLSYTPKRVFCCLCRENVGIDAEEITRAPSQALPDRYCSESEQALVRSSPNPSAAILRLWVLKEAYAKYTGRGIGNYLAHTHFDPNDPRIQIIHGCYLAIVTEEKEPPHAV